MGRTRSDGDLVVADRGRVGSPAQNRGDLAQRARDRDHQSARNHDRLGQEDRDAALPRHRLAMPAHRRAVRGTAGGGTFRDDPGKDRASPRSLLLGDQTRMDLQKRPRRLGKGEAGRGLFRDGRHLAALETDRGARPRDRRLERQPADALQYPHALVGRRAARSVRDPARDSADGASLFGAVRLRRARRAWRGDPHHRDRRGAIPPARSKTPTGPAASF